MNIYLVYSKSKIHGVYSDREIAENVLNFLQQQAGYTLYGIPKRDYYIEMIELDKIPEKIQKFYNKLI